MGKQKAQSRSGRKAALKKVDRGPVAKAIEELKPAPKPVNGTAEPKEPAPVDPDAELMARYNRCTAKIQAVLDEERFRIVPVLEDPVWVGGRGCMQVKSGFTLAPTDQ